MKSIILRNLIVFTLLLSVVTCSSCRKLVEVDAPPTSNNIDIVFGSDAAAVALMTGLYTKMTSGLGEFVSLNMYPELSADNLELFGNAVRYLAYYTNNIPTSGTGLTGPVSGGYWSLFYPMIYNANTVIENVPKSSGISPVVKDQLLGEAYFVRALYYYYLVNFYGEVPLVLSTSYKETSQFKRSPVEDVYKTIVDDLLKAKGLLNENYMDATLLKATTERLRPNKFAASALLSRTYLHIGAYTNAEAEASNVIAKSTVYDTVQVKDVFLKNSKETIWALQPVSTGGTTQEATFYFLTASGPNGFNPTYLSSRLMSVFETGDKRKTFWTSSVTVSGKEYFGASKYKNITPGAAQTEYSIVMRLAEQYLIRAEARALNNNLAGAIADLNMIRKRAGLGVTSATTKDDLLLAIFKERRVEFFSEMGHRWIDMKRTKKADEIMPAVTTAKGGIWKTEWQFYPLPLIEIRNTNNLEQNKGYQ